jgi:hypothetical protein
MRRSPWSRLLASALGLWFGFSTAEPLPGMHNCPTHDGPLAAAVAGGGGHHGHGAGHEKGLTEGSGQAPAVPQTHQCTCPGPCTTALGIGLPATAVSLEIAAVTSASRDSGLPDYAYAPVWAEHVLPFSNGPPRV